ncbi:MAG TPA: D-ribose pyranase [Fusibacter sp.]|nr:D-ribose pyranase [Fusibacter sp.]
MKKGRLLNSEIISTLSRMGHTDQITVGDAGLPIPDHVSRIDIALMKGLPSFLDTVKLLNHEMVIEKIILAEEIKSQNPLVHEVLLEYFHGIPVEYFSHESFKDLTHASKAVIRTGECTPYANIILQSGVDFTGDSHE